MVKLGGLVGAILGFAVSVIFTEVIFPNNHEWPGVFNVGLTVVGAFIGAWFVRRFANRNAKPSY